MAQTKKSMKPSNQKNRWCQLPSHLMGMILKRVNLGDYYRFSAVCSSWRSIATDRHHHPTLQLPWLMLSKDDDNTNNKTRSFFSVSEDRIYRLNMPKLLGDWWCCGSSEGWLVMVDKTLGSFLLNPITGARVKLPPISTIPFRARRWSRSLTFIAKAILSSPVTPDNMAAGNCIVAAINGTGKLAFCRPGDQAWALEVEEGIPQSACLYKDILFYNGKLFATDCHELEVYELGGSSNIPKIIARERLSWRRPHFHYTSTNYLVESCGELLLIIRLWNLINNTAIVRTVGFQVFKLDPISMCLVELHSLGNQMIFVGRSCSKSFLGKDFGFTGNCIYFTDRHSLRLVSPLKCDSRDIGVFHLKDQTIRRNLPGKSPSLDSQPIWITPNPW